MPNNPSAQNPFPGPVDADGFQRISGSCSEFEQVELLTGNLQIMMTLVDVPALGQSLTFSLFYNSLDTVNATVGWGWRHNFMTSLTITGSPPTSVVVTTATGRQYGFINVGGLWKLDTSNYYDFFPATLTQDGANWRVTFPDGSHCVYNAGGQLISIVDNHGNASTLTYTNGLLTAITEPCGRQIQLAYQGGMLATVTDPKGNATALLYTGSDLTSVAGPTGCVTQLTYTNHFVTSRMDPNSHSYAFVPDGSNRLHSVTDADGRTITYSYTTINELVGYDDSTNPATPIWLPLPQTTLVDARNNTWTYRFDQSGNLRRILEPSPDGTNPGHATLRIYNSDQKLIATAAGFPLIQAADADTAHPNANDTLWRYAFDAKGNMTLSVDPTGMLTTMTYDAARNMTSSYPGAAHLGVQGNWPSQFGIDGYLLCAFDSDSADLEATPSYVSSITTAGVSRDHQGTSANSWYHLLDPRATVSPTSLRREVGFWDVSGNGPHATISLGQPAAFNLSIYTNGTDQDLQQVAPMKYVEQFGHDLSITVAWFDGEQQQTMTQWVPNNAAGYWVTFPVQGDPDHPVKVSVIGTTLRCGVPFAKISALAFDPYDNHRSVYGYDPYTNDLVSITDPLGNTTKMAYNMDGTLATVTDANGHQTQFFYEDEYRNLTRVVEPTGAETLLAYDLNSNVIAVTDPNGHTSRFTYDGKDRLLTVTDGVDNLTRLAYDPAGNLVSLTDGNGNVKQFLYSPENRLIGILEILDPQTVFTTTLAYDASGNLTSVTDPRNHTTAYQYDVSERMTQATLPDGNLVGYGYDALDQMVAVTTPNGNLPDASQINTVNGFNWVQDPGAEQLDGFTVAKNPRYPQAQWWVPNIVNGDGSANGIRDTTVFHTGTASLKLDVNYQSEYFAQADLPLPPGVQALMSFWARHDGQADSVVKAEIQVRDAVGSNPAPTFDGPQMTLSQGSTQWEQLPPWRFSIPGDAQFHGYPLLSLRAKGTCVALAINQWFDDFTLYALSTAYTHDGTGRLVTVTSPDGARVGLLRDRFGRVVAVVDPRGAMTMMSYDSNDRLLAVTDPLGNTVLYGYDAIGNLLLFTDPNGNQTAYAYDVANRLTRIVYPDGTTELFGYDPAGNLQTYTNNRNQTRTFTYDAANRLVTVTYSDSTTLQFVYDQVGNVLQRVERNGDVMGFQYDALYRLVGVERTPAATGGVSWIQASQYDAVGNRIEFSTGAAAPVFDGASYDAASFPTPELLWGVPSPGYDSMDRLPAYEDRLNRTTTFEYDEESRRTAISYPGSASAPQTTASYDVVGKLMALDTKEGASDLLPMSYGYDPASNRVSLVGGGDVFDYEVDMAGRLTAENVNRFVERGMRFMYGTMDQCQSDITAGGNVSLVPFPDTFDGWLFNNDRWRVVFNPGSYVGLEVRQNNALEVAFPHGYCSEVEAQVEPIGDSYGLTTNNGYGIYMDVEHRRVLSGDFDVQVDFSEYQGLAGLGAVNPALFVATMPFEQIFASNATYAFIDRNNFRQTNAPGYRAVIQVNGTQQPQQLVSSSDTSGTFRITRTGSTVSLYYWDGATHQFVQLASYNQFATGDLYVSLLYTNTQQGICAVNFSNFRRSDGATYPVSGTYTSATYDAGSDVAWDRITWLAQQPASTVVKFQVAVLSQADYDAGKPWDFIGPDGTNQSFYEVSSGQVQAGTVGRYAAYQATLTSDPAQSLSPTLTEVAISYHGQNLSASNRFEYDPAGNMVQKTTGTPIGYTDVEIRNNPTWATSDRVNNLNQIKRNDVVSGPSFDSAVMDRDTLALVSLLDGDYLDYARYSDEPLFDYAHLDVDTFAVAAFYDSAHLDSDLLSPGWSASWHYSYDANGNMTSKTDGASTWNFGWDEDNRLTSVVKAGTDPFSVGYEMDSLGRMLSRTDATGQTKFEWDGFDCVAESAPPTGSAYLDSAHFDSGATYGSSGFSQYLVVNGELLGLIRDNAPYAVVADALGSTRLVIDWNGTVVSSFSYGAWGELLPSSFDNLPGGMPYLFVGGLGVRYDSATGLHYMRERWYDAGLGRFVSRDPLGLDAGINLYYYGIDDPTTWVDQLGLDVYLSIYAVEGGGYNPLGHSFIRVDPIPNTGSLVNKSFTSGSFPSGISGSDIHDAWVRGTHRVRRVMRLNQRQELALLNYLKQLKKTWKWTPLANCAPYAITVWDRFAPKNRQITPAEATGPVYPSDVTDWRAKLAIKAYMTAYGTGYPAVTPRDLFKYIKAHP